MRIKTHSPLLCVFCRYNACYEELPICGECLNRFTRVLTANCKICGKPACGCECSSDNVRALFFYEGFSANMLVYFVKCNVDKEFLDFLAELLIKSTGINPEAYDAIAYVPRRKRAIRRYGYDQAKELAKSISKRFGIQLIHPLKRVGGGVQKLLSAKARYQSIKNRYVLNDKFKEDKQFDRILLVDDVCTTGATIKACSEILRKNVSNSVTPLVLARTPRNKKH